MEVTDCVKPSLEVEVSDDIIYEILLKLPGKSLLRFLSLSRNWYYTIYSFNFANMHIITRARVAASEEPQILQLLWPFVCRNTVHSFVYEGNAMKKIENPILEFSRNSDYYCSTVEFVACGLLCFRYPSRGELYLYNPLLGEVLELPWPLELSTTLATYRAWYGIGFDSRTESYKIVRLCLRDTSTDVDTLSEKRFGAQVYTLGTQSWRVISSSVWFKPICIWGVSAYGDVHWIYLDYSNQNARIMSFDFKKEEFKDTPVPNFGCQNKHCSELIDLKGFLAVVSFPSDKHIDIWLLKNYEKKEWVREYRFSTQVWARELYNYVVMGTAICWIFCSMVFCNRGLVFEDLKNGQIFVLDLETNRVLCMQPPESYIFGQKKFSYTSSVLSLGHFGNPIAEIPDKYKVFKSARRVYVSP